MDIKSHAKEGLIVRKTTGQDNARKALWALQVQSSDPIQDNLTQLQQKCSKQPAWTDVLQNGFGITQVSFYILQARKCALQRSPSPTDLLDICH